MTGISGKERLWHEAVSWEMGGQRGKRRQRGMIEVLESRRLLSTWVTLNGPAGGSGPQGAPVEGNTLTYTVSYFWDSAFSVGGTVNISYSGTATQGQDYDIITDTVAIPSNPQPYPSGGTVSFIVPVKSDNLIENPETLIVRIGSSSPDIQVRPYGFPQNLDPTPYIQSTVSIVDDPPVVSLGVSDDSATENAAGEPADPGEITLFRSGGDINQPLSVGLTGSGTATFGTDYGLPDLVTFEAGQNAIFVPVTIIDDTEAEGIETAVISILPNPGTYQIAGSGSGTVSIDDNVSVQSITAAVTTSQDPQYPVTNSFSRYLFWVKVTLTGEHLDLVNVTQRMWCTTKFEKTTDPGAFLTDDQVLGIMSQFNPAADPNLTVTRLLADGKKPIDRGWNDENLLTDNDIVANTHNGTAIRYDIQGTDIPTTAINGGPGLFTYLTDISRNFYIDAYRTGASTILKSLEWGYSWTNRPCQWIDGDHPKPPQTNTAVSYKNSGKGKFYDDPLNITGLGTLN